jgi:hypothetical protein
LARFSISSAIRLPQSAGEAWQRPRTHLGQPCLELRIGMVASDFGGREKAEGLMRGCRASSVRKSAVMASGTGPPAAIVLLAAARFSANEDTMTVCAPARAKSAAISRPMPRLPPVTTATLLENSPDTIEPSVIAEPPETSFDVIKEGRLISHILGLPSLLLHLTMALCEWSQGNEKHHRDKRQRPYRHRVGGPNFCRPRRPTDH